MQEDLAGNAADVQARPAEACVLLDDRRPESGGLRLESGHVAPGTAPDHDDVERFAGALIHELSADGKRECYASVRQAGGNMAG